MKPATFYSTIKLRNMQITAPNIETFQEIQKIIDGLPKMVSKQIIHAEYTHSFKLTLEPKSNDNSIVIPNVDLMSVYEDDINYTVITKKITYLVPKKHGWKANFNFL